MINKLIVISILTVYKYIQYLVLKIKYFKSNRHKYNLKHVVIYTVIFKN